VVDAILSQAKGGAATVGAMGGYLGLELNAEAVRIDAGIGTSVIGAYITDLDPQSPAAQSGLVVGDVVTAINGRTFRTPSELLKIILSLKPGTQAKITLLRGGELAEVVAVVGNRPDADL